MIDKILDMVFEISGPLSIISMFAIGTYLYKNKVYSVWGLGTAFLWPQLIVDYRIHTKKNLGHVGIWFYVVAVSICLSLVSALVLFALNVLAQGS